MIFEISICIWLLAITLKVWSMGRDVKYLVDVRAHSVQEEVLEMYEKQKTENAKN